MASEQPGAQPVPANQVDPLGNAGRVFRHELSVRYGECDAQGVVFNANYLAYCDHTMDEFLRAVLPPQDDFELMLKAANLVWHAPMRYREVVVMECGVVRWGTTSMDLHFRGRVGDQVRFEATITYVAVADPKGSARPRPIDDEIRAAFDATR